MGLFCLLYWALPNLEWRTVQGKNPQAHFPLSNGVRSGRKWAPPVPVTHPRGRLSWGSKLQLVMFLQIATRDAPGMASFLPFIFQAEC